MNFQAVDQAGGKNITMWATLFAWEGLAFTTNQAKYLSCKLRDDDGIEHKCRIYEGKGALPGQESLNQRMEFSLSTFQGNYKGQPYTGYSGFWSHGATTSAPQNTQQAPSQPTQPTNYQPPAQQGMKMPDTYAYPVTPKTQERMAASIACQCAAQIYGEAPKDMPANEAANLLIQIAEPIKKWILGKATQVNVNPEYVGNGQEGICPHCQKLLEDCTCDIKF